MPLGAVIAGAGKFIASPVGQQLLGFGLSQLERAQSRGDIARQNAYNSPLQQIARLREAGLPNAALLNGTQAGNQSALPQTNKSLGNFITTQTQLKQLEILKAEIRLKNAEADESQARRDWLLSGRGEDRAGTNLTSNLRAMQGLSFAHVCGFDSQIIYCSCVPWNRMLPSVSHTVVNVSNFIAKINFAFK